MVQCHLSSAGGMPHSMGTRINSQCRGAAVRKGQLNLMVHYDCYAMGSGYNGDAKKWLQRSDRMTHPAGAVFFGDSRKCVSRFTFQKLKMSFSHNFAFRTPPQRYTRATWSIVSPRSPRMTEIKGLSQKSLQESGHLAGQCTQVSHWYWW